MSLYTNHYQVLKIQNTANKREIKAAYKKLAKIYHPDVYDDDGDQFKRISLAYSILSDEAKRKTYDTIVFGDEIRILPICRVCNDSKVVEIPCFRCNEKGSYLKKVKYGKYEVDSKIICTLCSGTGRINNVCKACKI
tara:strand:+ start:311 stop:721 length:411 start_codon:yes stop_codon:yes gene_type:complete